jgi:predicted DNA binding CopG/RHH family protein
MKNKNLKPLPILSSDTETEDFVATSDLTKFDLSGGHVMHFEFEEKDSQLSMRMPTSLLDAVKSKAKLKKMPYTRYIRMLIERDISAR